MADNPYSNLRDLALTGMKIPGALPGQPQLPFSMLQDWNVGKAVATIAAFADGSARI